MSEWKRILALLCTFGFLREMRPSEPYVTEYIIGPWRNITLVQLNQEIYPVGTYSYLALLIGVFLITDYLKYKPLILLSAFCGVITYIILLWTESLLWLQISQVIFGLYLATDVAYNTYMFAKVEQEYFKQVASWSRASALIGRFCAGTSAQLLYTFNFMDFKQLNYITLASQILAFIWAWMLPSVKRSIYFHRELKGIPLLWEHAKSAYTKPSVVTWSLIYALSMAGFMQVQNYMQLLWKTIEPDQTDLYNGLVQAAKTVLGAGAALLAGVKLPAMCESSNTAMVLPLLVSVIEAMIVLIMSYAQVLWTSYLGYTVFCILYHFIITFTSAKVAKKLVYESCYGLVFGINTLIALLVQSLLTTLLISKKFMGLSIRAQYRAVSVYYLLLTISIFLVWMASVMYSRRCTRRTKRPMQDISSKYDEDTLELKGKFEDVPLKT